jgi:hypothetical protein
MQIEVKYQVNFSEKLKNELVFNLKTRNIRSTMNSKKEISWEFGIPAEIICIIADFLNDEELYNFFLINKYFASFDGEVFWSSRLKSRKHLLKYTHIPYSSTLSAKLNYRYWSNPLVTLICLYPQYLCSVYDDDLRLNPCLSIKFIERHPKYFSVSSPKKYPIEFVKNMML